MGNNQLPSHTKHRYFNSLEVKASDISGEPRMYAQISILTKQILQAWKHKLQKFKKEQHFHMLIPSKCSVVESSYCGGGQIIELQYDVFDRPLIQDIETRLRNKDYYSERQIWYLIWTITEVVDQCERLNQRIGDINPSNIYTNSQGHLKMVTPMSIPSSFQFYYQPIVKDVYFSPEELKGRKIGQITNQSQPIRSASFSIGMTLLSIILLKPLYFLYDYDRNELDFVQLQVQLGKIKEVQYSDEETIQTFKYSSSLQSLIRAFLRANSKERITYQRVYGELIPHCNSIAQLKPFQLNIEKLYSKFNSPVKSEKNSPVKSEKNKDKNQREAIKLQSKKLSAKKQEKQQRFTPSPKKQPPAEIAIPVFNGFPEVNRIEYKYIHQEKQASLSVAELMRKIDERLQKSRNQFPTI